jgi:hypothetical protein
VPLLSPADKQPFLDGRLDAERLAQTWGGLGVGGGIIMGAAHVLVPVLLPGTLVATWVAYRFMRRKAEYDRAIDDPPRLDFLTPTRSRITRFHPDVFGETPLERVTVDLSWALLYADSFLSAMVRADERTIGAREAGDLQRAAYQTRTALDYARRFRQAESETAARLGEFSAQTPSLSAFSDQLSQAATEYGIDLASTASDDVLYLLPPEAQSALRRAGVPKEGIGVRAADVDPARAVAEPGTIEAIRSWTTDLGEAASRSVETVASKRELGPEIA